ncbi:MAG: pyruvate dehydrogenase (acetyl-transferring), homodimeric type, partial [Pseudomonadales bacterium]|nr:pyruvate dehydrogenase (acetyl-transferring), homodimeric type [Pseudomonadales bacterium]
GEGLQHQDGHSQAIAATVPNLQCYDPAFGYELAIIIRDGIDRMYQQDQKIFYYITLYNENYSMPAMPDGVEKQVLQGMCKIHQSTAQGHKVHLLGSGSIIQEVLKAAQILKALGCSPDIWSVTSYTQLTRNAQKIERQNLLDPEHSQLNDIQIITGDQQGAFVAVSDHLKSLPNGIARWLPSTPVVLGTDGFGLSEARDTLRDYFEVDAKYIAWGAMTKLFQQQTINAQQLQQAREQLQIPRNKLDPTEV